MQQHNIRNVAIIAHVDHGKTSLIDQLLQQSGTFKAHKNVDHRVMDSNDIEKERGITILAKTTSIEWNGYQLNIVDTPGHADFGGEVERILGMVDGVLILIDAAEGPMPQTKFVLTKALEQGLKPIVVINKVDKSDARCDAVEEEIFDLFVALNATDSQLDFPQIYASAKQGWASSSLDGPRDNMKIVFEKIVEYVAPPQGNGAGPFQVLATILEADPFVGRILTGRIEQGVAKLNMPIKALNPDGSFKEQGRLTKMFIARGVEKIALEEAVTGQIIAFAGLKDATVADTVCALECENALLATPIDPPTLSMTFSVNDSPLAGREGNKLTSRMIRDRLMAEMEGNISIRVQETEHKDAYEVSGRGELQLGVLIETMRREGFELSISRPRVLFKTDSTGKRLEPVEIVQVDVDEPYTGVVIEKLGLRKAEMSDMAPIGGNKIRLTFSCPSRGLIGYRNEFLTDTRGTGIMNRSFAGYELYRGDIDGRRMGVLISNSPGKTTAYSLWNLEDRGILFTHSGVEVYEGMVIGEHSRENDLDVNPIKGKKLSNVRASGKDEGIRLTPPKEFTLEQALSYIENDELVEITPATIRLRKRYLDPNERKRHKRSAE